MAMQEETWGDPLRFIFLYFKQLDVSLKKKNLEKIDFSTWCTGSQIWGNRKTGAHAEFRQSTSHFGHVVCQSSLNL